MLVIAINNIDKKVIKYFLTYIIIIHFLLIYKLFEIKKVVFPLFIYNLIQNFFKFIFMKNEKQFYYFLPLFLIFSIQGGMEEMLGLTSTREVVSFCSNFTFSLPACEL